MKTSDQVVHEIETNGYCIMPNVLPPEFIRRAKLDLENAIEAESHYHQSRNYQDYGMVLLCSLYGGSFLSIFDYPQLFEPFHAVLGKGCIVYAYTSSSMPPHSRNYSGRVHVDCPRIIPNYVSQMACTILLDDFNEDNGATWYLPASHNLHEIPSEDDFYRHAERLVAKAGAVFYFNARLCHAGGVNQTDKWRHALTFNICRSWMKQRIDIPTMNHMDLSDLSEFALQKLGFFVQVPASYDEYYTEPEKRKFKQKRE